MKRGFRFTLAALAAALGTLATAGTALAQYTPQLLVNQTGAAGATTIRVTVPLQEEATARAVIYVPTGYQATLDQAAGTTIGRVDAQANARAISPEAVLPLAGPIVTDNPANYAANPCAPGTHTAVWIMRLEAAGQTLPVPIYVDRITAGPEAAFASHKLTICLPSPFVPQSAGGAAFGAKLIRAQLSLNAGVFRAPPAAVQHVWRGVFTPYTTGTAAPNPAGTREAQSLVRIAKLLQLNVFVANNRLRIVRLNGRVTEAGRGVSGAAVQVQRGGSSRRVGRYLLRTFARKQTDANGRFTHQVRFRARGWVRFRIIVSVAERREACVTPLPGTAGCTGAMVAGFRATGRTTRPIRL